MSSRNLRVMRRSALGRDFGLSVRLLLVGGVLAAATRWEVAMDHPPLRKRLARLEEMARELGKPD